MKLVTFEVKTAIGPMRRVGVWLEDGRIADANLVVADYLWSEGTSLYVDEDARHRAPARMIDFIRQGQPALDLVRHALDHVLSEGKAVGVREEVLVHGAGTVKLLPPIPRPRRVHDFMVVEEHVFNSMKTVPPEWYNMPVCYKGNPDAIIGPGDTVRWPRYTEQLDYELELCAIIGRPGRNISKQDAASHIYGYTIFNDFSARDIQLREMSVGLGPFKGKDFATAVGPCIATADEFDPASSLLMARVNGEEWSRGTIGAMRFGYPEIIEYLSSEEDIFPGDILGSGTVGRGCGLELDKWIQPGDVVELEAQGIGVLSNPIGAREAR